MCLKRHRQNANTKNIVIHIIVHCVVSRKMLHKSIICARSRCAILRQMDLEVKIDVTPLGARRVVATCCLFRFLKKMSKKSTREKMRFFSDKNATFFSEIEFWGDEKSIFCNF